MGDVSERTRVARDDLVAATLRCISTSGVRGTSLDDVARAVGCSRATLYRLIPGGKPALLETVTRTEVARLFDEVAEAIRNTEHLEEALVAAISAAAAFLHGSVALRTVIAREPELILTYIAFDRLDPLLDASGAALGPLLERFLDPRSALEVVEWCVRLVLSYTFEPSRHVDLRRHDDVVRLVRTHVLPGATAMAARPIPDITS